jgi:hypothetical protein
MITLKDIIKTINTLLKANFPNVKIESSDNAEGFDRPSFYVHVDSNGTGQQNEAVITKKVGIRIYYFPTDEHDCSIELLEIQDGLDNLFSNGFLINGDTYINLDEDGIDYTITDNVLQALFYVNYMNYKDLDADLEYMEELESNIKNNK